MPDEPPIRVKKRLHDNDAGQQHVEGLRPSAWTPLDGHATPAGFIVVVEVATSSGRVIGTAGLRQGGRISYSDGAVIRFKSRTVFEEDQGHAEERPRRRPTDPMLEYGQPGTGVHHRRRGEGSQHQLERVRSRAAPPCPRSTSTAAARAAQEQARGAPEAVASPRPRAARGRVARDARAARRCWDRPCQWWCWCIGSAKGPHTGFTSFMKSARRIRIASACVPA